MKVSDLIREFCEIHSDKYSVYENYSSRFMFGAKCMGIIVRQGNSFMAMIAELTSYLDEYADEIDGTPFENVSYDNLGLDMIVYFPFISDDE